MMAAMGTAIGTPVAELDTPVLLLDLDALEHNIGVIAAHYRNKPIRLRPHGKNHKSPAILAMQTAAGGTVGGVCTAKISEAEAFAEADCCTNVLIANQIVAADKIQRLAALAKRIDTTVAVDAPEQVERLARGARAANVSLGVIVEIDTMMRRGGARSTAAAVALARAIEAAPNLRFRGVMSHQVPTVKAPDRDRRFAEGRRAIALVVEAKRAIEDAGIAVAIVSTGESWTYDVAATVPDVTEIQGGTYSVMEVPYAYMKEFRFAARVLGRVVERPDARTAIGDVPIEAIGAPNGLPTLEDAGAVANEAGIAAMEGVAVARLDHHGIELASDGAMPLRVGDCFSLLTHQQDVTMNRWDRYLGVRNGIVEMVIEASARGCVH